MKRANNFPPISWEEENMKQDQLLSPKNGAISPSLNLDRRDFLKRMGILGGGIIVYCSIGDSLSLAAQMPPGMGPGSKKADYNAFLRIGTDERITCFVGKVELGQGVVTSFPQIVAEELDVAYDAVDIIMGDTDLCPWDMGTFGSMSTRILGPVVRNAACEAKGVLKELAADHLKCPIESLHTKDGVVFNKNQPEIKVTYGNLTKGKVIEKHLKELPPLKSPSEFTIMAKPYFRRDSYEKVTGRAKFAGDIRLNGMLYASILRPPAHGAKLRSLDLSQAKKTKGVRVIRDDDLIATLHECPEEAEKALNKIKAEYDMPKTGLNNRTIYDHLSNFHVEPDIINQNGDIIKGRKLAKEILEETYLSAYVAHAPIETHTSIADVENGKITVWSATQIPFTVQTAIAETYKLSKDKVRVIPPFVGGGFGGKAGSGTPNREALEATRLAMLSGKPVQVAYTRSEEFFYDSFRPAAVIKIQSGTDDAGNIVFWEYDTYMAGDRCAEIIYDVPHHNVRAYGSWSNPPDGSHPFNVGPWRAPGAGNNIHAKELHMNLLAAKAGVDPLEFRLKHLKDERMIGVLKAAAEKFGYTPSKQPSGRGYGISCAIDANTYVAHIAEVDVDNSSGKIEVKRVVCAQDMGLCVNPQGAKIQMEGCITMGLGYALTEGLNFSNGEIFDRNFDTYHIPRFSWLPKIETIILKNDDFPPQGGGEPAITGIGAIIASGVYDATGAKLFKMPFTPVRVKEALTKV
jgi:isoquinoline 1-oxidoreductase